MGIHFLRCVHNNKCVKTHDAIRDTFTPITQNVDFHVGREQLHKFLSTTFNSFHWQINIMFTKNGICTLTKVVITDQIQVDLLFQSRATQGFVTSNVVETKEKSYRNQHPINQFFPLAIEVFGYLHKHVDVFLHDCANAI